MAQAGYANCRSHGAAAPSRAAAAGPVAEVTAACLVFALVLFLPTVLNDGDTLWQIRTGEWILDHRAIPMADPFSFTAGGRVWFPHEWLAEVLLAASWRIAGMAGVMVLTAAATGLTAGVLLHHLRRFLPGPYALLGLAIALGNVAPSLLARPHLLSWPCLALWCGGLVRARADRTAPPLALLPVMALWVNLHGSFMIGLLLPAAFLLEALLDPGADRRRVTLHWGGFMLGAWAAALLNPALLGGVLFPLHQLGMASLARIGEWRPTDFGSPQPLEVVILAGLALGLSGKLRLPPVRLLILLGLVHGALAHARHEQLLGIVGALVLAEPIGAALGRGGTAPFAARWAVPAGLLVAMLALPIRMALPLPPERTGAAFAEVLRQVPAALRQQPVLNAYSLGGSLIFQGVRPFIDSRADLYGDAFLARYGRFAAGDHAALEQALTEYGIAWTVFHAGDPVVGVLDHEPGWRRVVTADGIVIHARER